MLPILCLFDIDGTLVRGSTRENPTSPSLDFAFKKIFGITDFNYTKYQKYDGTTDFNIVLGVGKLNGIQEDELKNKFNTFIDEAIVYMENNYPDYNNNLLPCVKTLIGVLCKKGVICGVLTGNAEKKGWWKLKKTGLDKFIKFGAFGDSIINREELFPLALEKAETISGLHFDKKNIFIIGDTYHDIEVAKIHSLKSIAVATGRMTNTELKRYEPDYIFADLTKTKEFLKIIGID